MNGSTSDVHPRVDAVIDTHGQVYCAEGHLVGLIHEEGVEFFCRKCHTNVVVNLRASKLAALAKIADLIASL
jgi:hypothetical protein